MTPDSAPVLDLDIDSFFELTYRLSHLARHRLQALLASHNLTPPQYTAMRSIETRGNSISVSALAEADHQVTPTITGILNRLEERGLVIRRRSPADRRHQMVSLTPQGQDILNIINQDIRRGMGAFLADLAPDERTLLTGAIRSLTDRLASHPTETRKENPVFEE